MFPVASQWQIHHVKNSGVPHVIPAFRGPGQENCKFHWLQETMSWMMVVHAFNASTQEAGAGGSPWSTKRVSGQPGLHRETLS